MVAATKQGMTYNKGKSTVGTVQLNPHAFERKALIEARHEQYFGQLADVRTMPKNSGTVIKQYHYLPLLDDANINDQGIDAAGAELVNGNLYGSSKDIGLIPGKLPLLGETGGRVNRVGFKRKEIEGTFEKFGMFTEWSKDLMNFDSDADLLEHIMRELMTGAMQVTEDALQIDLLTNAGTVYYTGTATTNATIDKTSELTYSDLMRVAISLDNNRTPKQTKIITGTRNIDTKTIPACRVVYCGSEMIHTLEAMKDLHGERAFIPVNQYAAGTTLLKGERGAIGEFRFIVVPNMLKWSGVGAGTPDAAYHSTGDKYDVFPLLIVGDESFTTIGFQTDGKSNKFETVTRKPGTETADRNDPYGEMGFSSIKWWYGFMGLRTERIAVIKSAAKL